LGEGKGDKDWLQQDSKLKGPVGGSVKKQVTPQREEKAIDKRMLTLSPTKWNLGGGLLQTWGGDHQTDDVLP